MPFVLTGRIHIHAYTITVDLIMVLIREWKIIVSDEDLGLLRKLFKYVPKKPDRDQENKSWFSFKDIVYSLLVLSLLLFKFTFY